MRSCRWALLAVATIATWAIGGACDDDDERAFNPFPSFSPAVNLPEERSTMPPSNSPPTEIVGGVYDPEYTSDSAVVALEPFGFVKFDGDEANGIRVFEDLGESSRYRNACGDDDYWKFEEFAAIEYEYLPPETYASSPPFAGVCPDGSIASVGQSLYIGGNTTDVGFYPGRRSLLAYGDHGGRFRGEIGGRPAVFVAEDYYGQTASVAIAYPAGVMLLHVNAMPVEDIIRFAEGLTCDLCEMSG